MIEFYGELSEHCKEYILKKERKIGFLATFIVSVAFSIPIIILTIVIDWIFIVAFFALILINVLAYLRPSNKTYGSILPKRVCIKNEIIESEGDNFYYAQKLSRVKIVWDMGEWYHIFFNYKYKNPRFICQKNLIQQGTLKEFEQIFDGKIVKKNS